MVWSITMIKILAGVYAVLSGALFLTIILGTNVSYDKPVVLFFQAAGLLNIFLAAHFLDLVYQKETKDD